jgi:GNAT superfamily N-acetyltransferase
VRARGMREPAALVLARGRQWIWWRDRLIVLVREAGGEAPQLEGFTFRAGTAQDAPAYAKDVGTDSAAGFRARLDGGSSCYLVTAAGRIVHSTWLSTGPAWTRELQRYLVPPAGDAYVYESFTRPEARGRGLYRFALQSLCALAAGEGIRRMWVAVEHANVASLRAVTKAGFEAGFEVGYRRLLGNTVVDPPAGPLAAAGARIPRITRGPRGDA